MQNKAQYVAYANDANRASRARCCCVQGGDAVAREGQTVITGLQGDMAKGTMADRRVGKGISEMGKDFAIEEKWKKMEKMSVPKSGIREVQKQRRIGVFQGSALKKRALPLPDPMPENPVGELIPTYDNLAGYMLCASVLSLPAFKGIEYISKQVIEDAMGDLARLLGENRTKTFGNYTVTFPDPDDAASRAFYNEIAVPFLGPDFAAAEDFEYGWRCARDAQLTSFVKQRDAKIIKMLSDAGLSTSADGIFLLYEDAATKSDAMAVDRAVLQAVKTYATAKPGDHPAVEFEIASIGTVTLPPPANNPLSQFFANQLPEPSEILGDPVPRTDATQKIGQILAYSVFSRDNVSDADTAIELGKLDGLNLRGDVAFFVSILVAFADRVTKKSDADQQSHFPRTSIDDVATNAILEEFQNMSTVSGLVDIVQALEVPPNKKDDTILNDENLLNTLKVFVPFEQDAVEKLAGTTITSALGNTLDDALDNYWAFVRGLTYGGATFTEGQSMIKATRAKFEDYAKSPDASIQQLFALLIEKGADLVFGTNLVQITGYRETLGRSITESMARAVIAECGKSPGRPPSNLPTAPVTLKARLRCNKRMRDATKLFPKSAKTSTHLQREPR